MLNVKNQDLVIFYIFYAFAKSFISHKEYDYVYKI